MIDLQAKIALVTGASRGIGKAIALRLAQQGAFVIGTATTLEGAEQISQNIEQAGFNGLGLRLQLQEEGAVEALMAELEGLGKIPAILVNNAGITCDNLMLRMDDEEWDKVIATNLTAVFKLSRACLRPMVRGRFGRIISIGSVVGSSGNAGQANYAAAKAGLLGFSKSLAQEVGSRNITINVVSPGFIETDMTDALPDTAKEVLLSRIPLRKMGRPEDIAAAVAFLASESASYITGHTLHVNGGMYME